MTLDFMYCHRRNVSILSSALIILIHAVIHSWSTIIMVKRLKWKVRHWSEAQKFSRPKYVDRVLKIEISVSKVRLENDWNSKANGFRLGAPSARKWNQNKDRLKICFNFVFSFFNFCFKPFSIWCHKEGLIKFLGSTPELTSHLSLFSIVGGVYIRNSWQKQSIKPCFAL